MMKAKSVGGEVPTNGAKEDIEQGIPYIARITLTGASDILFHRWNCDAACYGCHAVWEANKQGDYRNFKIKQLGMKDKSGRKVKVWRLVKSAFDEMNDIYIPIYYKNRGKYQD